MHLPSVLTRKELEKDIANGQIKSIYFFWGEETYLKRYYLNQLKNNLINDDTEGFNYSLIDGKKIDVSLFLDEINSLPVFSDKKLIVVRDYSFKKANDPVIDIISDLPSEVCLIFYYEEIVFSLSSIANSLNQLPDSFSLIEFSVNSNRELITWIQKRFKSNNHFIDSKDAEYLIFNSGGLMEVLINEINKISSYAENQQVTRENIDAVIIKRLDARIYELTDALSNGKTDKGIQICRDLFKMGFDPIVITSAISNHLQRLLMIKELSHNKASVDQLKQLWKMKSSFPLQKLTEHSAHFDKESIIELLEMCSKTDIQIKSCFLDGYYLVELLVLKFASSRK